MKIGYSVIFDDNINNFENNLIENHQIELNLRTSPKKAFAKRFEIENVLKNKNIKVLSVHYPGDKRIDEKKSIHDLKKVFRIADLLEASTVVLHPPKISDETQKSIIREEVLNKIHYLQENFKAKPSFETFAGSNRLFTPQDIVDHELTMVLDTTHLEYIESEMLINYYSDNISTIHLSARELPGRGLHLRLDSWCYELSTYLVHDNYQGNIILEYRQEDVDKMPSDYECLVESMDLKKAHNLEGNDLIKYLNKLNIKYENNYSVIVGLGIVHIKLGTIDSLIKASKYFHKASEINCFTGFPPYMKGLSEIRLATINPDNKEQYIANAKEAFKRSLKISDLYKERIHKFGLL